MKKYIALLLTLTISACASSPDELTASYVSHCNTKVTIVDR